MASAPGCATLRKSDPASMARRNNCSSNKFKC